MNSELVTHSDKIGYIYRYDFMSGDFDENGNRIKGTEASGVRFRMVLWFQDGCKYSVISSPFDPSNPWL